MSRREVLHEPHARAAVRLGQLVLEVALRLRPFLTAEADEGRWVDGRHLAGEMLVAEAIGAADLRLQIAGDEPGAELLWIGDGAPHPLDRMRVRAHVLDGPAVDEASQLGFGHRQSPPACIASRCAPRRSNRAFATSIWASIHWRTSSSLAGSSR